MADSKKKTSIKSASKKKKTVKKAVTKKKTTLNKEAKTKKKTTQKKPVAQKKKVIKKANAKKSPSKKVSRPQKEISKTPKSGESENELIIKDDDPKKENKEVAKIDDEDIDPAAFDRGDEPMTVVDHLDEFRSRILIILGVLIGLTFVSFYFSEYIVNFINIPFVKTGQKLNVFKLMGGFLIRLKASAVIALLLTVPLIFFQIWKFIVPAINKSDRMFSRLSLFAAILLFYGGMAFVFFGLVPFVIPILIQFIPSDMLSTIGADDYLSFILLFSIAMGVLFELPIVIMILSRIGLITPAILISKRKYAVVATFIIGAFITPQDPLSMIMVAVPLMFLYEISILISRFMLVRRKKKDLME